MNKIAIIGLGYVGSAYHKVFPDAVIYDPPKGYKDKKAVNKCDLAIVCIPTPSKPDGSADTSLVEKTVSWLKTPLILIKSTIPPGTTKKLKRKYKKRICHSPEYIGEGKYHVSPWKYPHPTDIRYHNFMIIGGAAEDREEIINIFLPVFGPERSFYQVDETTSELIKYMENAWGATKVTFCNEFYEIAKKFKVDYNQLREGFLLDSRVERMHTAVFKYQRGFSGKCLVSGTKLELNNGKFIDIDDVVVRDKIRDKGGFTTVTQKGERVVNGLIRINAGGRLLCGSEDHLQLVRGDGGDLIEKGLRDVTVKDWVYVPRPQNSELLKFYVGSKPNGYIKWWLDKVEIDFDWARLIGLYLAEGCSSSEYSIIWSFGESEELFASEVVSILEKKGLKSDKKFQIKQGTFGESRCWIVRCRSAGLSALFEKLGLGKISNDKSCPILANNLIPSIVGGWLDGDGCLTGSKGTIEGASVSEKLIDRMDRMLLSVGIHSNKSVMNNGAHRIRIARKEDVKTVSQWTRRLKFNESKYIRDISYGSPTVESTEGGWFVKIRSVESLEGSTVFSVETESHTYIANGILTHNCFPKDVAAIVKFSEEAGYEPKLIKQVVKSNEEFKKENNNK